MANFETAYQTTFCNDSFLQILHCNTSINGDFVPAYNNTVVRWEGGYRNVSWDAETYRGINRKFHPNEPIWKEIDKRKPIANNKIFPELEPLVFDFYKRKFWSAMNGEQIKSQGLTNYVFDYIVQSGTDELIHLQQCINYFLPHNAKIWEDGDIGSETITALNKVNAYSVFLCLQQQREVYYASLFQQGILSQNDWKGVWNRLKSFDWIEGGKEAAKGGAKLLVALGIGYGFYRVIKSNK